MHKLIASIFLLSLLTGCASGVKTTTATYHGKQHEDRGSIIVLPTNEIKGQSLADEQIREYLLTKLLAAGYTEAKTESVADYIAKINYEIDSGTTSNSTTPIYGQIGGGTSYTTGTVSRGSQFANYSETTVSAPIYGVVGTRKTSTTLYGRTVDVTIWRNDNAYDRVYEMIAASEGRCSNLSAVIKPIIDGMFQNFPGKNSLVETIIIDWEGDC